MSSKLSPNEWMVVLATTGLLLTLTLTTFLHRIPPTANAPLPQVERHITVHISGAVAQAGSYTLKAGARMSELLELARPLDGAILPKGNRRLSNELTVEILEAKTITVWVEGAVLHSRFYTMKQGSRVGDLLKEVELAPDAVTYSLRKRTPLADRQTLVIPHRKRRRAIVNN